MKRMLLLIVLLAGCRTETALVPDPVTLTQDALGHYCLMQVDQHPGPKAQIHLEGLPDPIFFTQVRDALAYVKGSEREADILVVYVNDMGAAKSWEDPGADNWIAADGAVYVVGADVRGGMGAPEIVPFADADAAQAFVTRKGGEAMTLEDIPESSVLAPVEIDLDEESSS